MDIKISFIYRSLRLTSVRKGDHYQEGEAEVLLKEVISVSGLTRAKRTSLDSIMTMVKIDS